MFVCFCFPTTFSFTFLLSVHAIILFRLLVYLIYLVVVAQHMSVCLFARLCFSTHVEHAFYLITVTCFCNIYPRWAITKYRRSSTTILSYRDIFFPQPLSLFTPFVITLMGGRWRDRCDDETAVYCCPTSRAQQCLSRRQ